MPDAVMTKPHDTREIGFRFCGIEMIG